MITLFIPQLCFIDNMLQQHKYFVTRTDDFTFKKTGNRREPISESYQLNLSIEEMKGTTRVAVEYPAGIAGLISSFQPFTPLGRLLKDKSIHEVFGYAIEIDLELPEIKLTHKEVISQQLEQLQRMLQASYPNEYTNEVQSALDYLLENYESYLLKDVELIFIPLFLDAKLFSDEIETGYYESPGFFQADAGRIEREGDSLYIEGVKGARLVQNLFASSMRKLLNDFKSYGLVVDDSTDAHVNYFFCEINRNSTILRRYINLYRANSVLTDKRVYVEIREQNNRSN